MKILFRSMKLLDINQVKKINEENLPENYSKDFWIETFHDGAKLHSFVAEAMTQIIGYVFSDQEGVISLAVDNRFRGKGIAEQLMKHCLNTYTNDITLHVRKSNLQALNLYKKLGFNEKDVITDYYINPTEDALLLFWKFNNDRFVENKKMNVALTNN